MSQPLTDHESTTVENPFDNSLGAIGAAAEDATLLAFSMAIEGARTGAKARESVLVAQAMGELSHRATVFCSRMRECAPARTNRRKLAHLHQVSTTVVEILQDAARLAADDLDGMSADETAHKNSARLAQQIQARVRELDAVLDAQ